VSKFVCVDWLNDSVTGDCEKCLEA
jgi:hypothetical protein